MADRSVPPPATTDEQLATLVITGCIRAESVVQSALSALLRTYGITPAGFNVLMILEGDPRPLCPHEISERRLVTRGTVTGVLDSLEKLGLIERRPNPDDRRSLLVGLTARGRALLATAVPEVRRVEGQLLVGLSAADRTALIEFLGRVAAAPPLETNRGEVPS